MKKIGYAILAAGLLSASVASAATSPNMQAYHGGFNPLVAKNSSKATLFPATDISIINASDRTIRVTVPNTPVSDWVNTKSNPYHVTHGGGAFYTNIVIEDNYYNTIFNSTVCPRALITIYGDFGNYSWNVDEEYCH